MDSVKTFASEHPGINFVFPDNDDYQDVRKVYNQSNNATPLGIAQPKTVEDISALVKFAHTHSLPITVRSGGNDLFGRSFVSGVLAIDVRALDAIDIDVTKKTAKVAGGVTVDSLAKAVAEKGCIVATGSIGWYVIDPQHVSLRSVIPDLTTGLATLDGSRQAALVRMLAIKVWVLIKLLLQNLSTRKGKSSMPTKTFSRV